MNFQPKKKKYKKVHTPNLCSYSYKSNKMLLGNTGLQASESGFITSKQLEAARVAINRKIKRKGKIWIRVFPSLPITRKPTETRMGKGKGQVSHWIAKVSSGNVLFEICCSNSVGTVEAFLTGGAKLPIKTRIIKF